ncbi:hypothetical protein [Myxococcus sp. Y35]
MINLAALRGQCAATALSSLELAETLVQTREAGRLHADALEVFRDVAWHG